MVALPLEGACEKENKSRTKTMATTSFCTDKSGIFPCRELAKYTMIQGDSSRIALEYLVRIFVHSSKA
jgi:hypothetical protein